jgi:alkylated DNA repair dioxygenase AlkB
MKNGKAGYWEQEQMMHDDQVEPDALSPRQELVAMTRVEASGWSLHPGRYVAGRPATKKTQSFKAELLALHQEFQQLTQESHDLEEQIAINMRRLLET